LGHRQYKACGGGVKVGGIGGKERNG
jgi:hypothetical protein